MPIVPARQIYASMSVYLLTAGPLDLEPGLIEASRQRVDFDAEGGHRPAVNDVVGGGLDADHGAHRHHHMRVGGEQARLTGLETFVLHHIGVETDILIGVAVGPVPLMTGRLDREVGLFGAIHGIEQLERGEGDTDQNQHRNQRPGDFQQRMVRPLLRYRMARMIEAQDDHGHQHEHQNDDRQNDRGDGVVQADDVAHDRRSRVLRP